MSDEENIVEYQSNVSFFQRFRRVVQQFFGINPFGGDCRPSRVKLFHPGSGRPSLPFPHPWNYSQPLQILETFFWNADKEQGSARHNRYLSVPGFSPVLVTRDPGIIRAILSATGHRTGQFDRDTLPSQGIARATGEDTLLFANGPLWRRQRKLAAPPFGKTTLFQPERFQEFEETFRNTIQQRIKALQSILEESGQSTIRISLEPEIKVVMLEMLVNNFFGAEVSYEDLRNRFVTALERVIDHIVKDTVINKIGLPIQRLPTFTKAIAQTKADYADFEKLTDLVLAPRKEKRGLWKQFRSDAPDAALRSNIRVFLAGALEATTSFASWALSHLARNVAIQEQVFQEVKAIDVYTPENLARAPGLRRVLEETLRFTPSLYFLPRRATVDTWVETADKRKMLIPQGTHILLDVWHANRREDYWGVEATGYAASEFAPDRWNVIASKGGRSKDFHHFGFGHGARVCPGKFLGELEVSLVVGAVVKTFKLKAVDSEDRPKAGVSTKPQNGVFVDLGLR